MSEFLITGAAGFIGSAVAKRIMDLGNDVTTIDNLSTGNVDNIPKGVHFIEGDCQNIDVVNFLHKKKFDAIIHIAGQSSGEVSFDDPVYDLQTNTQSTLLLLKLAVNTGCRKFIYTSSMSVYGDQSNEAISEDCVPCPKSFYAVGKLASEQYARIFSTYGVSTASLRLFNVYGPGQNLDNMRQGMISIYLSQALREKKILVKGDALRFRDFVYIDDVVNAYIQLLTSGWHGNRIYNVATGTKTTVGEVLKSIISSVDETISVEFKGGTPGDQYGIYGDNNKIIKELGWKPTVQFNDGMSAMIEWARSKVRSEHF